MRWKDLRRSDNVRDERGMGGGGGFSVGRGVGGVGAVAILVVAYFVGGPDAVLQLLNSGGGVAPSSREGAPLTATDDQSQFVAAILGSTEDVWGEIFAQQGKRYSPPLLELFDGSVQSACG